MGHSSNERLWVCSNRRDSCHAAQSPRCAVSDGQPGGAGGADRAGDVLRVWPCASRRMGVDGRVDHWARFFLLPACRLWNAGRCGSEELAGQPVVVSNLDGCHRPSLVVLRLQRRQRSLGVRSVDQRMDMDGRGRQSPYQRRGGLWKARCCRARQLSRGTDFGDYMDRSQRQLLAVWRQWGKRTVSRTGNTAIRRKVGPSFPKALSEIGFFAGSFDIECPLINFPSLDYADFGKFQEFCPLKAPFQLKTPLPHSYDVLPTQVPRPQGTMTRFKPPTSRPVLSRLKPRFLESRPPKPGPASRTHTRSMPISARSKRR